MNPKPAAAEKLPPLTEDPEAGQAGIKSPTELAVSVPARIPSPSDPLFKEAATYGLRNKGGKKSRKHKKRTHKKTQKRRGRK